MVSGFFAGLRAAGALAAVGLFAGIVAGMIAFGTADGAGAVARKAAETYPTLVLMLPAALGLMTWNAIEGRTPELARILRDMNAGRAMLLTGAIAGSLAGCLLFMVAVILIASFVGGEDLDAMTVSLFDVIGWLQPAMVLTGSVVVGQMLAWWGMLKLNGGLTAAR